MAGSRSDLTQRQREILHMWIDGCSMEAIADTTSLTEATVRRHIRLGLERLNEGKGRWKRASIRDDRIVPKARCVSKDTGLMALGHAIAVAAKQGVPLTLLMLKTIGGRDVSRRDARDTISEMSRLLLASIRCDDILVRWEEDTFLVILSGTTAAQGVRVSARLRSNAPDFRLADSAAEVQRGEHRDEVLRRVELGVQTMAQGLVH